VSEGIVLPTVARGTLLPEAERVARLDEARPQILAALAGETDDIARMATLACLLWETLPHANWCGFYRKTGEAMLTVGPYQGTMGCLRITFDRGVCGAAARTQTTQLVPDVHLFPGHIACDARSRSEVVVPVTRGGELLGVLDVDSPHVAAFSEAEAARLEHLVRDVFDPA
jgi:GAF domain-containing protein